MEKVRGGRTGKDSLSFPFLEDGDSGDSNRCSGVCMSSMLLPEKVRCRSKWRSKWGDENVDDDGLKVIDEGEPKFMQSVEDEDALMGNPSKMS